MPVRATPGDVVGISASTTDDTVIQTFINVSNSLINAAIASGCTTSDATVLRQAEAFLAAHLLTTSGGGIDGGGRIKKEEKFENYSVKFAMADINGEGVLSTNYGVTANMLMGGCLSDMNSAPATIEFFG